jgi:transcriptional regulator with XRE-family HTH domain
MRNAHEKDILKQFAKRIRTRRLELGLTQMELAERANCHLNAISKIENGLNDPSLLMFIRLTKALKVSPNDLLKD